MKHRTDLTYEAQDLVAPFRSGLRRMDWRRHADRIREVTALGGDDYAMAGAMGATRKHMLDYATEVSQFADVLHTCLDCARKGTSRSWSTTWAWKKTAGMARGRERPASTHLPPMGGDLHTQARGGSSEFIRQTGDAEFITSSEPTHPTESARRPRELRAENWREHAIDIIKIGQSGGDDYSMAAQLRVSRTMLLQYASAVPQFNDALMYARTCARAWWDNAMRLAIKKRSGLKARMVIAGHAWIMQTDDTKQSSDPRCSGHADRTRKRKRR